MIFTLIVFEVLAILMINTSNDIYQNLGAELIGILLTVVVIDWLYHQREDKALKKQLITEAKSIDNADALKAIGRLKDKGKARFAQI